MSGEPEKTPAPPPATTPPAPPALRLPAEVPAEFLEFQPDSLEVELAPLPGKVRLTLYLAAALLVTAILWACLAEVDRIVTGQGKIAAPLNNVVLSALEPAVIRNIAVIPGQRVAAGEVLVTLDATFAGADLADAAKRQCSLAAQLWRMECELGNGPCTPPDSLVPAEAAAQAAILAQRKSEYQAKMAAYGKNIASLETQRTTLAAQQVQAKKRIGIGREMEGMHGKVFEMGAGSKLEMLKAENERIQYEAEHERLGNEIKTKAEELAKAKADREGFAANWTATLAKELVDTQRDLAKVGEQLEKAKRVHELIELRAPVQGVVLDLARKAAGGVAEKAETLVTLVPLNAPLEAQVEIPAKEIGFVRDGDPVRVKLEAFPFQKHGVLEGRVTAVSEDAFSKDTPQGPQVNYRARIELTRTELRDVPKDFRLIPGLTLTAEIKVGKRRVISYLLYPVIRALDESMREP